MVCLKARDSSYREIEVDLGIRSKLNMLKHLRAGLSGLTLHYPVIGVVQNRGIIIGNVYAYSPVDIEYRRVFS